MRDQKLTGLLVVIMVLGGGILLLLFRQLKVSINEATPGRDFFENILQSMNEGLLVFTPRGRVVSVNTAASQLLGYEKTLVNTLSLEDIFPKELVELLLIHTPPNGAKLEKSTFTKEGREIPVLISNSPMRENGKITGYVCLIQDMTEQKKLQSKVLQSDKLSAIGQLAAGVAHEINNPLGIILGFAQGLARNCPPKSPMDLPLKSIEREASRCKDLVQDLLTFSRDSRADRGPLMLNETVGEAISLIEAQAKIKQVDVRQNLKPGLPRIFGNKNQIQQIVINLANNAMDVLSHNGILIITTDWKEDVPQSWVELKVSDNGPGIPAEVLPRIFEPFFTTKPIGKGTGLGLSLVHEIVKKHSGLIDVESRPGLTEFRIQFPVRTERELLEQLRQEQQKSKKNKPSMRIG